LFLSKDIIVKNKLTPECHLQSSRSACLRGTKPVLSIDQ